MRYLSASARTLFILQILSLLTILIGLFIVDFNWTYVIISIATFYCYSILGISMMLHRFYSHKSFQLHPIVKWIFTIFAILSGRGSVIGWVYIHRIHHATSDTEKDPHSPHFDNFKIIGFKPVYDESKKINYFIVKDLLYPIQIYIDKFYLLIIFSFLSVLFFIDFNLIFYMWALPIFLITISQTMFNYFGHKSGYRNFKTKDRSTNNFYLWPFILGDAWHNNHHANSSKISTKTKWYEFDPVSIFINLIKKN